MSDDSSYLKINADFNKIEALNFDEPTASCPNAVVLDYRWLYYTSAGFSLRSAKMNLVAGNYYYTGFRHTDLKLTDYMQLGV